MRKERTVNKGRLIGGIICLAIAILLGVLNLRLEDDQTMFMVGGQDRPWLPVAVLAVIGIALLITVRQGAGQEPAPETPQAPVDPEKAQLNKRMEAAAWGLFLIMLGGSLLVGRETVPKGWWTIGVGVIMLGLNLARYLTGIKMSGFTVVLGCLAVIGGILELTGKEQIEGAVLLIILGAYLLLKPYFDRRALFGSAEERESGA
jgi:hypothetical protein